MNITMHRFFISKESLTGENALITDEAVYQISRVLRLKPGDHIIVLDNTGWEYEVAINVIKRDIVQGKVVKKERGIGEPKINLIFYQALLKTDKFEFVLQKGVELGVNHFIPFVSKRCVVKKPSESRIQRWQNIIREASEQSRRARLPALQQVLPFEEACQKVKKPALILWESEKSRSLADTLKTPGFHNARTISIFVGPEGGFETEEIELAGKSGIVPAGLGNRILRAETAGLVAISAIMYEKGELA